MNDVTRQDQAGPGNVHPDELMAEIARSTLNRTLPVSLGVHAVVILLTSIPFLINCVRYGTMNPLTLQAAQQQAHKNAAAASAPPSTNEQQHVRQPAAEDEATRKSAIEREVEETDSSRPMEPTITLDDELNL